MRFHWTETRDVLEDLLDHHDLVVEDGLRAFVCPGEPDVRFEPPLVQPIEDALPHPDACGLTPSCKPTRRYRFFHEHVRALLFHPLEK